MSHEHLGLFDTPPTRAENGLALAIVGLLSIAFAAVIPMRDLRLGDVGPFVPAISAVIFVGELIVAALLYAQAAVFRSRALTVLASSYVFTALLLIPYALTFPGAFAPGGMLHAGVSSSAWLMIFRRWTTPLSVTLYVLLREADSATRPEVRRAPPPVLLWVSLAAALCAALTVLATAGHDLLPPLLADRSDVIHSNVSLFAFSDIALLIVAMALLFRRRNSVLDTWLLVALAAAMIQSLLNLGIHARFTFGWYCLFLLTALSHLFVLIALIAESNRLYVRMALTTAARGRDRDARLMSMDALAAAIAHEVGQPLAAVTLGASAALSSLTREQPDPETAIKSLRNTIDAGKRAFAVVNSIRAMFGKRTNSLSEFDLNDLVRECAALLDADMAAQRISLRLSLDEALPPIVANRIQIQRVLVNLMTNAIDALGATKRRTRRIAIRSGAPDADTLRVEISDSGIGIAPEAMTHIFEPFFTNKPAGTGLGLSLSRAIVEDHGGRLWASQGEDGGATFHLELHRTVAPPRE